MTIRKIYEWLCWRLYRLKWLVLKRFTCWRRGCQIEYFRDDNMPDDARYAECHRCNCSESNYVSDNGYLIDGDHWKRTH